MGIPADYVDKEYEEKVKSTSPVSSMPLVPKEPKASQECVGGNQKEENLTVGNEKSLIGTGKLSLIVTEILTDDRPSESGSRAPIKMIDACPWSPNISKPQIDRKESRGSVGEGIRSYLLLLIINLLLLSYTRAPTAIPRAAGWDNALHQHLASKCRPPSFFFFTAHSAVPIINSRISNLTLSTISPQGRGI